MTVEFYEEFEPEVIDRQYETKFVITDQDTFTAASYEESSCCLNFASHKRPGGGYRAVMGTSMPLKTQEEDLFRRSNLPEIMDTEEVREYYPLKGVCGLYCVATVAKDKSLNTIEPFDTGIITAPAVVNPTYEHQELVRRKVRLIFNIAHDKKHKNLILGAWGCGVFGNDPEVIAKLFEQYLINDFKGVFEKVIFAIPGKESTNYKVFASVYCKKV